MIGAKLIVGLGNPGPQHNFNRHNVGFLIADALASSYGFSNYKSDFKGMYSKGKIAEQPSLILKPMTYMNLSGESVLLLMKFHKIILDNVWVIHDDLDVPLGKIKYKYGGGNGGHNGLASIDNYVGNNYHRLRIGISHPGQRDLVTKYVLTDFNQQENIIVDNILQNVTKNFEKVFTTERATWLQRIISA